MIMSRRGVAPKSPRSPPGAPPDAPSISPEAAATASLLFDQFCAANTFQAIMHTFHEICEVCDCRPTDHQATPGPFYKHLKHRLTSWKAQSLWAKLDKRAQHREYRKGTACHNTRVSGRWSDGQGFYALHNGIGQGKVSMYALSFPVMNQFVS